MSVIFKLIYDAALTFLCVAGTIFLLGAAYGFCMALTAKQRMRKEPQHGQ